MLLHDTVAEMIMTDWLQKWFYCMTVQRFFCSTYEGILIVQEDKACSKREIMHATAWFAPADRECVQSFWNVAGCQYAFRQR